MPGPSVNWISNSIGNWGSGSVIYASSGIRTTLPSTSQDTEVGAKSLNLYPAGGRTSRINVPWPLATLAGSSSTTVPR